MSSPRAATVVVLAAVVAAVGHGDALVRRQSFLTSKKAAKVYVSNKKASTLYLKKKAASNLYVAKATAPLPPVVGIAAGTAQFGPVSATTAGYIPTAFTSFATKAEVSSAVITFSGHGDLHGGETGPPTRPARSRSWSTARRPGKSTSLPSTAASPTAGAGRQHGRPDDACSAKAATRSRSSTRAPKDVTFTLKSWNLAVQAYPQPEEPLLTEDTGSSKATARNRQLTRKSPDRLECGPGSRFRSREHSALSSMTQRWGRGRESPRTRPGPVEERLVGPVQADSRLARRLVRFCPVPAGNSSRTSPVNRPRERNVVVATRLDILVSFLYL